MAKRSGSGSQCLRVERVPGFGHRVVGAAEVEGAGLRAEDAGGALQEGSPAVLVFADPGWSASLLRTRRPLRLFYFLQP